MRGVVMRTRNVSEYMLVLALCLVVIVVVILQLFVITSVLLHCWLVDTQDVWPVENLRQVSPKVFKTTGGRRSRDSRLTRIHLEVVVKMMSVFVRS